MKAEDRKRWLVWLISGINDPAAVKRVCRFSYRTFLSTSEPEKLDYFSGALKYLPQVPEEKMADLYSIIRTLAKGTGL